MLAALHGATGASVSRLSVTFLLGATKSYRQGLIEQARDLLLEALSWREFTMMRGDYMALRLTNIDLTLSLYDDLRAGIVLTDADFAEVSQRAQMKYQALNMERIAMGLDSFSDALPKGVEKHWERAIATLSHEGVEGWAQHTQKFLTDSKCVQQNITRYKRRDKIWQAYKSYQQSME